MFNEFDKYEIIRSDLLQKKAKLWAIENLEYLNKPMTLLGTSTKIIKDNKVADIKVMYLDADDDTAKETLCLFAKTSGCGEACLKHSGRLGMSSAKNAMVKRTILYLLRREWFEQKLLQEIDSHVAKVERNKKLKGFYSDLPSRLGIYKNLAVYSTAQTAMIRLNGTSDLDFSNIIEARPDVQFYDYTKHVSRIRKNKLSNYDLTYSASMFSIQSRNALRKAVKMRTRIAVAINTKDSKADKLQRGVHFKGIKSFDDNDIRPYDGQVVGTLSRKGSSIVDREADNELDWSFFVTMTNLKEFNNIIKGS